MIRVTRIQTDDGQLHMTTRDAIKYLEVRFADEIFKHASKLAGLDKYTQIVEYLALNILRFKTAITLREEIDKGVPDEE